MNHFQKPHKPLSQDMGFVFTKPVGCDIAYKLECLKVFTKNSLDITNTFSLAIFNLHNYFVVFL